VSRVFFRKKSSLFVQARYDQSRKREGESGYGRKLKGVKLVMPNSHIIVRERGERERGADVL